MKKALIFLVAIVLSSSTMVAQQKVGHINAQSILEAMPEFQLANDSLKLLAESIRGELTALETEFKTKLDYFEKNAEGMSDAMRQIKAQELEQMRVNYETYQRSSQNEIMTREAKVLQPLEKKIMDAIGAVAKEHGYAYVIDASMLIYADGDDIGPLVKKQLNIPDGK